MSLINQMLRDLEQRSRAPIDPQLALVGLRPVETIILRKKRKRWQLAISFILCTMIAISSYFLFSFFDQSHLPTMLPPAFSSFVNNVEQPTTWHTSKTALTGITLQVQKNITSLRLLLNQNLLYRINMDATLHSLHLILENTKSLTSLPILNYAGSALHDIKMQQHGDGSLEIILQLKQDSELQHVDLVNMNNLPELQLDFFTTIAQENTGMIRRFSSADSAQVQLQQALYFSKHGDINQAIGLLTELVSIYPDFSAARESLVELLWQNARRPEAEKLINLGLQKKPFYPPFIKIKARMLVNEGKVATALNLLQLAAPTLQQDPEYHAFIAALYQRQGQAQMAANLYEQLLALHPNNSTWLLGLGIALENLGKYKEASHIYTKADRLGSLNPELRAFIRMRMQENKGA